MISDSSSNNYLLFRNTADNGTYGGIAFQDNNIGGYVVFGNAGGGGDLLYVAGYGGGALQYGTSDSINPAARTTVASWNATGLQINSGDMRAPIYYDSDNTAYFLNPNSGSQLNVVSLGAGSKLHLVSLADGNHYLRYAGTGFSGVTIDGPQLAGHQGGELATNMGGDNYSLRWDNSGNTISRSSSRAPIFYDSNDTAYYADPASTSVFSKLTLNGKQNGYNQGIPPTSGTSTPALERFYAGYGTYGEVMDMGFNVATSYGWIQATNYSNLAINYPLYLNPNGGFVSAGSDFRAPIFYDSNDTGYYCDPNSTSQFRTVQLNNGLGASADGVGNDPYGFVSVTRSSAANYSYYGMTRTGTLGMGMGIDTSNNVWFGSTSSGYNSTRTSVYFYMDTSGNTWSNSSSRAPIFYDSDNTGYYADFSSTASDCARFAGGIVVSQGNVTGNGIILADDGDIVDLNDGYCAMRFSSGVRIHSGNRTGGAVILLSSGGSITASNNITAYGSPSDRRLKENIQPLTGALNKVMQLQGCTFDWKEDSEQHTMVGLREDIGFIADEVQEIIPEMVRTGVDGYLSLRDRGFSALLVEAMKEQQAQIAALRAEINALRAN
jgi:hypothetical protein